MQYQGIIYNIFPRIVYNKMKHYFITYYGQERDTMMRVADFFCGSGGFSEGFRQAGFDIVFAVDKWAPAVTTYKGNKPNVNVIQDDVIRLSLLEDSVFEELIPDTEVIIGSPPCQAFSRSNKSGNADKTLGICLIEAYLRIIARKKFKKNSILKYWVLENVPNVERYIKKEYTAEELGLEGDFVLQTRGVNSGIYNAKYYGAPTNRIRFLCGDFPKPSQTNGDQEVITLGEVLESLKVKDMDAIITDINYPSFGLPANAISDLHYTYSLAPFEWKTAKRLKQDKGYMGRMAFPENLNKPARTVMATMSASSREAMVLEGGSTGYRLPSVREAASMMSFPIDYRFYGNTKGIKHTLVGNAVPPKLSYAVAKAIANDAGIEVPKTYIPIEHDDSIPFYNLNGETFATKEERPRRLVAKFKYHIPYLIISSYRVELTNYHSDFEEKEFRWDVEIHYSQGVRAAVFHLSPAQIQESIDLDDSIERYINSFKLSLASFNDFQQLYCMTTTQRETIGMLGPYELLENVRIFLDSLIEKNPSLKDMTILVDGKSIPVVICIGYAILSRLINIMKGA